MKILGIDTGGTFTDFVYFDEKRFHSHKVLSTPDAPEQAILQGISDLGLELSQDLRIVHGTTVATNSVLEGKGARVVYITNRGFKDILTIGRQARKELYNLKPKIIVPPVPDTDCLETGGRIDSSGEVLDELSEQDLVHLKKQIQERMPEAVAINLLFSYLEDRFEKKIEAAIGDSIFVCRSSKVLPVFREYERGITTWLNAYVGPIIKNYLGRLQKEITNVNLSIMRSSGNTCDSEQAGEEAVHLLLSGPAGGLIAALDLGRELSNRRLLTFDMGGTSTDVALIDGKLEMSDDSHIAGYPVGVPMVNIHTIGAGGGSIAYIDEGGLLQVGPESAGAFPGPACYGQGGEYATVTDANVLLGRIPAGIEFGSIKIDINRSEQVISGLTNQLGLKSNEETAKGIIKIANEHMSQALRVISVERGVDTRDFSLLAFGGAGGLHVCELAEQLGMRQAVAPRQAGVLSALGMLVAKPGRQLTQTVGRLINELSNSEVQARLDGLVRKGQAELINEGHQIDDLVVKLYLDLCYRGQAHSLTIDWTNIEKSEMEFHQQHHARYGHRLSTPVELVNVRITVEMHASFSLQNCIESTNDSIKENSSGNVFGRNDLTEDQVVSENSIICDAESTLWIAPGWRARKDQYGNILLDKDI